MTSIYSPPTLTELDEANQEIRVEEARAPLSVGRLFDFGPTETTPIEFLDGFKFPASGAAIIGARTGSGKTSALINFAREYLNQDRSVSFVSYEMNAQEIALALALSLYAQEHTEPIPGWTRADDGPGVRIANLDALARSLPPLPLDEDPDFHDLFSRVKEDIAKNGEPPEPLKSAYDKIKRLIENGKLALFDAMGNIDQLARHVRETRFDAYLVDYLQVIPAVQDFGGSYKETASICDRFRELVNKDKKLIIAGAQFNRTAGEEAGAGSFDPRPDQFREAADIEQVATLAIGIGFQTDEEGHKRFFYKILKNRFAGRMNGAKLMSGGYFDFYFAQRGGRWTLPEYWPKAPRKAGKAQSAILEILTDNEALTRTELVDAWKTKGGRSDHLDQSLKPLMDRGQIQLGDDGRYRLIA